MNKVQSFPPIASPDARLLILGSMPGVASLTAGQYYAHPRNHFWPVMEALYNSPPLEYPARADLLHAHKIALWDVLRECVRPGSLDSAITDTTPNDFTSFFAAHPRITHVFFNGKAARDLFNRWVLPTISGRPLVFTALPSTSPANASWSFARKRAAWQCITEV